MTEQLSFSEKPPSLGKVYQFTNIKYYLEKYNIYNLNYRLKYKLDGTQGGIYVDKYGVRCFSKNRFLTQENDNAGFTKFIYDNLFNLAFASLFYDYKVTESTQIAIIGEYIGVSGGKSYLRKKLKHPCFAIFLVKIDNMYIYDPYLITKIVSSVINLENTNKVKVIPYLPQEFNVKFDGLNVIHDDIDDLIFDINNEDPLIKMWFDVSVPGDGIIGYPLCASASDPLLFYKLLFKTKTYKYTLKNRNRKKSQIQVDPETYQSIEDFVDDFLTTSRLEQGFNEVCDGEFDIKLTGNFLKWMFNDIMSESELEREHNNITDTKLIHKIVSSKARHWYFQKDL